MVPYLNEFTLLIFSPFNEKIDKTEIVLTFIEKSFTDKIIENYLNKWAEIQSQVNKSKWACYTKEQQSELYVKAFENAAKLLEKYISEYI